MVPADHPETCNQAPITQTSLAQTTAARRTMRSCAEEVLRPDRRGSGRAAGSIVLASCRLGGLPECCPQLLRTVPQLCEFEGEAGCVVELPGEDEDLVGL